MADSEDKAGIAGTLDTLSKAVAVALICAYGAGYLTVSIYCSSLGMGLVNPLKPQILAAGLVFLLLTISPAWASYHSFDIQELKASAQSWSYPTKLASAASSMYTAAVLLAWPASVLFTTDAKFSKWNSAAYVLLYVVDAAFWASVKALKKANLIVERHPWIVCLFVFGVLTCWLSLSLGSGPGFSQRKVALWFFSCGFLPLMILSPNFVGQQRSGWPQQAIGLLLFLAAFPTKVYPHVLSRWGGGSPIDAIVTLSKDSSILPGASIRIELIEQDESGLYVVPASGKKATFIPRSSVGAILFSENPADSLH